ELGPHDELMARRGAYWRLYEAQARRVDAADSDAEGGAALIGARLEAEGHAHAAVQSGRQP
ncbi:MAG: hypothetical protein LC119_03290, partial [Burkholderiales bacterium]|nr:hypothetical protein [Burkholderiales bacterium]